MTTIFKLKRLLNKVFSGIGRNGYPTGYVPEELRNDENLPVIYDVSPLTVFAEDLKNLPKKLKLRVKKLISSLEDGNIYKNNSDDDTEFTHSRERANTNNYRIFSKDVDNEHRLIYGIRSIKKEIIKGVRTLVVRVKLIECSGHDSDREIKDRISGNMSPRDKKIRKKIFSKVEEDF